MAIVTSNTQIDTIDILSETLSFDNNDLFFVQRGNSSNKLLKSNFTNSASVISTSTTPEIAGNNVQDELNTISTLIDDLEAQYTLSLSAFNEATSIPTGAVYLFAGDEGSLPIGYLICGGQTVSQATYPGLYAIVGNIYGSDGGGNFTLPDLRGRTIAGVETTSTRLSATMTSNIVGTSAGDETHQLTENQLPTHTHNYNRTNDSVSIDNGFSFSRPVNRVSDDTGSAGSDTPHNNTQPSIILNYIIKT